MFKFLFLSLFAVEIAASGLDGYAHSSLIDDINDADGTLAFRQLNTLPTIAELVDENSSFDTLSAALKATDLDVTLKGAGPFTVLAPTDKVRLSCRPFRKRTFLKLTFICSFTQGFRQAG